MLISERESLSRPKMFESGATQRRVRKSMNRSANSGKKPKAPLIETFKGWLYLAKQAQLVHESKRDLMALQLAHEEGALNQLEVYQRVAQLIQPELEKLPETETQSNGAGLNLNDSNWYLVHYTNGPQRRSGRVIVSVKDRIVTAYFRAKRCDDIAKFTFTLTSSLLAAEFAFSLLGHVKDLSALSSSDPLPGSQGLYALSMTASDEDRSRADLLVNKIVPRQLVRMRQAADKIRSWWLRRVYNGNVRPQEAKGTKPMTDYCATLSPVSSSPDDSSTTNELLSSVNSKQRTRSTVVHRRTKTMRNNARLLNTRGSTAKRRHIAATKIQAVFRMFSVRKQLERERTLNESARKVQRLVRAFLRRRRAARIIVRFCRVALTCMRRRRAFAEQIIRQREGLHKRISEDVENFSSATSHTMVSYYPLFNHIVDHVRDCARRISPFATLEPFGSSVTGLALPSSDLDLVVCFNPVIPMPPPVNLMKPGPHSGVAQPFVPGMVPTMSETGNVVGVSNAEELAHLFCKHLRLETDWVETAKVVGSSSQPVIKLICHPRSVPRFSIHVDLTLWHPKHTGIQNSRLVRDFVLRYHPQVGPLVLVIKQYMRECRLNSVYSGGLSSVALAIMVWVLVRDYPNHVASLGELLLNFFATYGDEGFFARNGVSAKDGIYRLSHVEERREDYQAPAVIEDPLREGNNLAMGMFRVNEVSACFRQAHTILVESKDAHPLRDLIRFRPVPVQLFSTQPVNHGRHNHNKGA